jgi:hypothetical protein
MEKEKLNQWFKVDSLATFFIILLAIFIIWCVVANWLIASIYTTDPQSAGQLGDTLGFANSLFSALAFGGLFYTILIQRKELRETKQEFIEQNYTLKQQRFENTFFNLLALHNDLVNNLEYKNGKGRAAFDRLLADQHKDYFDTSFKTIEDKGKYIRQYNDGTYPQIKPYVDQYVSSLAGLYSTISWHFPFDRAKEIENNLSLLNQEAIYLNILKRAISFYEIEFLYLHISLIRDELGPYCATLKLMAMKIHLFDGIETIHSRTSGFYASFHK